MKSPLDLWGSMALTQYYVWPRRVQTLWMGCLGCKKRAGQERNHWNWIQLKAFLWQQLPPNLLHLRFVLYLCEADQLISSRKTAKGASSSTRAMDSWPALFGILCSSTGDMRDPWASGPCRLLGPLSHCGTSKSPGFFQHIDAGLRKKSGKHHLMPPVGPIGLAD